MGDLIGHVLPGTFFCAFGIWWAWSILHRYYACLLETREEEKRISKRGHKIVFKSTITFPCMSCCPGVPVEAICIVVFAMIGVIGEFLSLSIKDSFGGLVQPQHMMMYTFFGLCGSVVILLHYKFPLPPDSDYAMGIMAFVMEGFLFAFHLHERSPLDVQIHQFLVYAIFASAIASALEMKYRTSVLAPLCRTYCTILQGTWFYQVGFMLYPLTGVPWSGDGHESLMKSTIVFGFHNLVILIFLMLLGVFVFFRVRNMTDSGRKRILLSIAQPSLAKYITDLEDGGHILLESEEEIITTQ